MFINIKCITHVTICPGFSADNSQTTSQHVHSLCCSFHLSSSQRREAPFRALAWGEGTNSVLLFTSGRKESISELSLKFQWPPWLTNEGWSFLISRIWQTIRKHLRWLPMVLFSYNWIYRDQTLSTRITRGMFVTSYNKIFHIQN